MLMQLYAYTVILLYGYIVIWLYGGGLVYDQFAVLPVAQPVLALVQRMPHCVVELTAEACVIVLNFKYIMSVLTCEYEYMNI
jgi:hypothetical protein